MTQANTTDFVIIGAGIVGLALACELKRRYPDQRVSILEKEPAPGRHASGRNSGVLHRGLYYPSGSLKARVCSQGARELAHYCEERRLPIIRPGKLLVPTAPADAPQLDWLESRAREQGIAVQRLDAATLAAMEPDVRSATGEALLVPSTAVVKPRAILDSLVQELHAMGVEIRCGGSLQEVDTKSRSILWNQSRLAYGHAINCAGAQADVIAHRFGAGRRYTLLPFRGGYWKLDPRSEIRVRHLVYPVPDLRVPFLGIHTTTSVDSEAFDFVAVEDCGLANVRAMQADTTDQYYNVGTGKRTSLKELAELLLELTGCDRPIRYAPRSQATLVRNRIGCPKKAVAEIGFTATIDLREGLKRLIEWRAAHKAEVAARRLAVGLDA